MLTWISVVAGATVPSLEVCNGVDDDGDAAIDEGPVVWAADVDGDGRGDPGSVVLAVDCSVTPPSQVADLSDCDDEIPTRAEQCNALDDDCDGEVDEGACDFSRSVGEGSTWLVCVDALQWEDARDACGTVGYHLATFDASATVDAVEDAVDAVGLDNVWIGLDDRASEGDWQWDDGGPFGFTHWAPDQPNDFFGQDCVEQDGAGEWNDHDCDYPQPYVCEVECVALSWHLDEDGDGLGDPGVETTLCQAPERFVANGLDCDDGDPGQPAVWHEDNDGDGFGDLPVAGCPQPGWTVGGDCDDTDPSVNPDARDVADDGLDQDCDGFDSAAPDDPGTGPGTGDTGSQERPAIEPAEDAPHPGPSAPAFGFGCGCASSGGSGAGTLGWLILAWLARVARRPTM